MARASTIQTKQISFQPRLEDHKDPVLRRRYVLSRSARGDRAEFKLSDGTTLESRRYLPLGEGDVVRGDGDALAVWARREDAWLDIGPGWLCDVVLDLSSIPLTITFKEIETAAEMKLFQQLRQFHYRGRGGTGRTLPLIGTVTAPDLPRVIGFVELTSAMIANTARKRFFDGPYREVNGLGWTTWGQQTSRDLSSLVCRISRFVIHPEVRGLGLAAHFVHATVAFARARWHYGGYRPRFLEITADMLRYYPFVGRDFVFIGETEGNEHRVSKDMSYLVRRALSDEGVKAMPQGGGGIMSLQRGYATTLLGYIQQTGASLEEAVSQLQFDPSALDQLSWEKLHRLNRRPKPCYVAGLTDGAQTYLRTRALQLSVKSQPQKPSQRVADRRWLISQARIDVEAEIVQSRDGRLLQDAFGFVGSALGSMVVPPVDLEIKAGEITLICGASGAGKSLFLDVAALLLQNKRLEDCEMSSGLKFSGVADRSARIETFKSLDPDKAPVEMLGSAPLSKLLMLATRCGLAEPQLLVRPIRTLSSGQKYRLQIALAFLAEPEIILIDNFCESLDRFSTRAVCKGLVTLTRQLNVAALLATAAYDRLSACLKPDQVILLRRGDEPLFRGSGRFEV